jgi:alkylation response protein AidB-like acyl-CoA dehydrogenase
VKVAAIAAEHAAAVDRDSRFPAEAIAGLRAERLMGVAVPREFGGEGAGIGDMVDICCALGRACAATAMGLCDASDQGRLPGTAAAAPGISCCALVQRSDGGGGSIYCTKTQILARSLG